MTDMEARLRRVEDKLEIAQLRAHYCHVLDGRRWNELAALGVEAEAGAAMMGGGDALVGDDAMWHRAGRENPDAERVIGSVGTVSHAALVV